MLKPQCYAAGMDKLGSKDAYVIDNGEYIFLYLGNQVDSTFVYNVSQQNPYWSMLNLIYIFFRYLAIKTSQTWNSTAFPLSSQSRVQSLHNFWVSSLSRSVTRRQVVHMLHWELSLQAITLRKSWLRLAWLRIHLISIKSFHTLISYACYTNLSGIKLHSEMRMLMMVGGMLEAIFEHS